MKIYLLDRNSNICNWWKFYFTGCDNVEIICDDFAKFMNSYKVEAVVSPANSFGLMDGGYDLAITNYFGDDLSKKVQKYIIDNLYGEQPIGTSIIIDIDDTKKLIHTPTMRVPSPIREPLIVYNCMRTCLMLALDKNIESIVIPAFGGDCGNMNYSVIAEMMYKAYIQVLNPPKEINWDYAYRWCPQDKY